VCCPMSGFGIRRMGVNLRSRQSTWRMTFNCVNQAVIDRILDVLQYEGSNKDYHRRIGRLSFGIHLSALICRVAKLSVFYRAIDQLYASFPQFADRKHYKCI
jgi:hypothetical protein